MIPKIIHYCWLSGQEYTKHIKENIASWKEILPDYEFILWDANHEDLPKNQWVREAMEKNKFAFASDFIRLYALYRYGGIYLDTDVEILKSFDDILHLPYFIGAQHDGLVEAAIIGAEKKSDWVLDCMRHYDNRSFIKEDGDFDMSILPNVIQSQIKCSRNLAIMKSHELEMARELTTDELTLYLFPFDYFCAKNHETGKIFVTDNTYTVHHFNSAWLPLLSKIRRRLVRTIGVQRAEKLIELSRLRKLVKALGYDYRSTG